MPRSVFPRKGRAYGRLDSPARAQHRKAAQTPRNRTESCFPLRPREIFMQLEADYGLRAGTHQYPQALMSWRGTRVQRQMQAERSDGARGVVELRGVCDFDVCEDT